MKINHPEQKTLAARDIPVGKCFELGGKIFIRTNDAAIDNSLRALNLKTGKISHHKKGKQVIPVNAEVIIKEW